MYSMEGGRRRKRKRIVGERGEEKRERIERRESDR